MPSTPQRVRPKRAPRSAAACLEEAERLFRDFAQLTPFAPPKPFVKSFESFADYETWRRGQRNPWLR